MLTTHVQQKVGGRFYLSILRQNNSPFRTNLEKNVATCARIFFFMYVYYYSAHYIVLTQVMSENSVIKGSMCELRVPNITGVPNKNLGGNFFLKIDKTGNDLLNTKS